MIRLAGRALTLVLPTMGLLLIWAPPASACGLTYVADLGDPAQGGCGAAAPAIGAGLLAVAAFIAAAVSLATGAGAGRNPVLEQAIASMLYDIDAQALAGAQARLAATAAGMDLPVQALTPGPAVPVVFAPTTPGLVRDLGRSAGMRADYGRQLGLGQGGLSTQTVEQLGRNLDVPQPRNRSEQGRARGDARARLERSLTIGYRASGMTPSQAAARAAAEADAAMGQLSVLHVPDLVAGGYATQTSLGLARVNSSIGSSLRPDRLGRILDGYIASIPPGLRTTTLVNLILILQLP